MLPVQALPRAIVGQEWGVIASGVRAPTAAVDSFFGRWSNGLESLLAP
jgi:hypothetical protein